MSKLYGRIVSIGPDVEDKSLEPGMIAVFDANGVRDVVLSQVETAKLVAISSMMIFATIDEDYVKLLGLPLPEEFNAERQLEQETPVEAVAE